MSETTTPARSIRPVTHRDAAYDGRYNMWLRPATLDEMIAKESAYYTQQMPERPGDVLLDIGANIGAVALQYLRRGIGHIICVEPEPDNIAMLRKNTAEVRDKVTIIPAAVVPDSYTGETTKLLVSPGQNRGAHSTVPKLHSVRDAIEVPVIRYGDLFAYGRPEATLLKIDIEGGEYAIAQDIIDLTPERVRALTMELHVSGDSARIKGLALNFALRAAGWGVTAERNSLMSSRTRFCLRTYERRAASVIDDVLEEPDSFSSDRVTSVEPGMAVMLRDGTRGIVVSLAANPNYAVVQFDGETKPRQRSTRGLTIIT